MKLTEERASFSERCRNDFNVELERLNRVIQGATNMDAIKHVVTTVRVLRVINTRLTNLERWCAEIESKREVEKNRFARCETVSEVIAQAVGAGSTCWVGGTGAAVFDSEEATRLSEEATEQINQITKGQKR